MFKFSSALVCVALLLFSVPASAAPATAWEDEIFAPQPSGQDYVDGLFANRPSDDVFGSTYAMSYVPNYVAPPTAPPPLPPPATYIDDDGSYCREFSQRTHIGGSVRESFGTACLQSDGVWRVVQRVVP